MSSLRLYQPSTTVAEFPHRGRIYKDVEITWFIPDREEPLTRYEEVIQDYRQLDDYDKLYAEESIQEFFTEQEFKVLQEYLLLIHDDREGRVEEISLPIKGNTVPFGAMPVGRSSDFYMLSEEPEYSLLFKVFGYFNVEGCKVIGQREPEPAELSGLPSMESLEDMEGLDDLFFIPTSDEIAIDQRTALYTQLSLSPDEVLFLEKLDLEHAITFQQLTKAFLVDLMSSGPPSNSERPEMAKAWLRAFLSPKAPKKGWQYLWKASN